MSTTDLNAEQVSPLARAVLFTRVREELRIEHPRLTDRHLDLIADVVVELRLTSARLGFTAAPAGATLHQFRDDARAPHD